MAISQINSNSLASGVPARSNMPAGSVLQVVQTTMNSALTFSFGSFPTWQAVTGLSVSITPTSSSSKILVLLDMKGGPTAPGMISGRLERNSSAIYVPASGAALASTAMIYFGGSNIGTGSMFACYLDSPATTSATTYSASVTGDNGATAYVNRDGRDGAADPRTISSITVMEIAA